MTNSYELFVALKNLSHIKNERELLWWPNSGTFEVIVGTILTQQTKWEKVEQSLENLRERKVLDLESLANINQEELSLLIKPSGFYNTKAKNLQKLCQNIIEDYGNFKEFTLHVNNDWLLSQKGIGEESRDCILCYACKRDVMVVDSYTNRLLNTFGYEFESYEELQDWIVSGVESHYDKIVNFYEKEVSLNVIYARFHGKIVEFCKENARGKKVDISSLSI